MVVYFAAAAMSTGTIFALSPNLDFCASPLVRQQPLLRDKQAYVDMLV